MTLDGNGYRHEIGSAPSIVDLRARVAHGEVMISLRYQQCFRLLARLVWAVFGKRIHMVALYPPTTDTCECCGFGRHRAIETSFLPLPAGE